MGKTEKEKVDFSNWTEAQQLSVMGAMDSLVWLHTNKIMLGGGQYSIKGHEYQMGLLEETANKQVCIKGAQMGITEVWVLKTLHGMIHGIYPSGSLYLFPTQNDVGDFSKSRFDPLIDANPSIGAYVISTDSQHIKKVGNGFLYLRGARATKAIGGEKKSSASLKSIPVDRIVFDERDEMADEMVTLAEERVSHSHIKDLMYLGTPTIPDFGVDQIYQDSDQRVWMLECKACGEETCLELEFPDCIHQDQSTGRFYRACKKCGREIFSRHGTWRALFPDRAKDMVGWWISQLNSVYIDPGIILNLYNNPPHGDLSEIMNSKLGRAYVAAENRLSANLVWGCCGPTPMKFSHDGPCFMGVDVGKKLNVIIGVRKTRQLLKLIKICEVDDFNDLHELAMKYNVSSCVIDYKPEIHKVREFQASEPYSVYACDYVERKTGSAAWDERDGMIKVNRTEICDATHELVINPGRLELPSKSKVMEDFVFQMCNIAKSLVDDPYGGKEYRYRSLGSSTKKPDHYRHAMNYALLASERSGIQSENEMVSRYFNRRRVRTATSWMGV